MTYSAYIDAIERGPFDDWPLVVAETRRPVFQGTVNHWHDNFYNTGNIDVFNNSMRGDVVPAADDNVPFANETHTSIDDEDVVKDEIEREIGLRVTQ